MLFERIITPTIHDQVDEESDSSSVDSPKAKSRRSNATNKDYDYDYKPNYKGKKAVGRPRKRKHPSPKVKSCGSKESSVSISPSSVNVTPVSDSLNTPNTSVQSFSGVQLSDMCKTTQERYKQGATMTFKLKRCTLCGNSNQHHKKYKMKWFCPFTNFSPAPGLDGVFFKSFEDFKIAVDNS